jgi:CheY-like chemotaxis protein
MFLQLLAPTSSPLIAPDTALYMAVGAFAGAGLLLIYALSVKSKWRAEVERVQAEIERRAQEEQRAREEAERKRKEAERKAREERERQEAERKRREEAERKAREEKEREEAEHKRREEAERKAREEKELRAKEQAEAERKAREEKERAEAERKRKEAQAPTVTPLPKPAPPSPPPKAAPAAAEAKPAAVAKAAEPPAAAATPASIAGPARKVLLVEDSATMQKAVVLTLACENVTVTALAQGAAAVDRARELRPHLVIADLSLADKDGYQICRELRADAELAKTPVLLLHGSAASLDEGKLKEVGASAAIRKPFDTQELIDRVRELTA